MLQYETFILLAMGIGLGTLARSFLKQQIGYLQILWVSLAILILSLVGGRLLFLVLYPPSQGKFLELLLETEFRNFTLYGALSGAFLAVALGRGILGYSIRRLLDDCVLGLAVSLIVSRMACVVTGCCYGKITHAWIGIPMVEGSPAHLNYLKDHPFSLFGGLPHLHFTQGYEILVVVLAMAVALGVKYGANKGVLKSGLLFWYFAVILTAGRFVVFFFRDFPDSTGLSDFIRGPVVYGLGLFVLWKVRVMIQQSQG